jgi:hypothetical protein
MMLIGSCQDIQRLNIRQIYCNVWTPQWSILLRANAPYFVNSIMLFAHLWNPEGAGVTTAIFQNSRL